MEPKAIGTEIKEKIDRVSDRMFLEEVDDSDLWKRCENDSDLWKRCERIALDASKSMGERALAIKKIDEIIGVDEYSGTDEQIVEGYIEDMELMTGMSAADQLKELDAIWGIQ